MQPPLARQPMSLINKYILFSFHFSHPLLSVSMIRLLSRQFYLLFELFFFHILCTWILFACSFTHLVASWRTIESAYTHTHTRKTICDFDFFTDRHEHCILHFSRFVVPYTGHKYKPHLLLNNKCVRHKNVDRIVICGLTIFLTISHMWWFIA